MSTTELAAPIDPLAFHVGDRLRKARELRGLDRTQLADELGISRKTLAAYETWTGLKAPREQTLRQWSMATGVSLHWLKTGEQPPDGPLAQLVESRTFNPKSQPSLRLLTFPTPRLSHPQVPPNHLRAVADSP